MEYTSIIISSVIFFFSLSLLVMVWSKKPTQKHIKEMEEAGLEIAQQIQEATEESLRKIEDKIDELDQKYVEYEEKMKEMLKNNKQELQVKHKEVREVKEETKEIEAISMPKIDLKDEKAKKIYELHKKGYSLQQISKEMNMYAGVVQVYMNLFKMNKAI